MTARRIHLAVLAAFATAPAGGALAAPGDIHQGRVHWNQNYDGDTFRVGPGQQRIRLWGIDAPESEQACFTPSNGREPCGAQSKQALRTQIGEREVRCEEKDRSYDRVVARCWVGDQDLAQFQAVNGWAIAYVTYTRAYEAAGIAACRAPVGIWALRFEVPSSFRGRGYPTDRRAGDIPAGAVRGVAFDAADCSRQSRTSPPRRR